MFKSVSIKGMLLLLSLLAGSAQAKLVQILHTNDTHSFLDSTHHNKNEGGSSRMKGLMDYYREKAASDGIKTITLDGGDFLEGNIYYMADKGLKSFEVHNSMGYDAVVLGNHDYLMGARGLDEVLGRIDLNFALLGANIKPSYANENIRKSLKPYKELSIDGMKIAILGLTTSDFFYSWTLEGSRITNPIKSAQNYERILKNRNNDFIFAVTHIGVNRDLKLASKTNHIDLIVGGHSHTALHEPVYEQNRRKVDVPVVQAGFHGKFLGRIIVDLEKGKPLKVVSYELVPVRYQAEDPQIKEMVRIADEELNDLYGQEWLEEKIAESELEEDDKSGSRKWAYFIADALREKTNSDVAMHVSSMNGENYPIGDITRRDLINSIPRAFELSDVYGWNIYTTKVSGSLLKTVCETLAHFGQPLSFSGMTIDWIRTPFGSKVASARINGKKINPFKEYKVAFTEGIVRGAIEISPKTKIILRDPKRTEHKIWQTLEEKLRNDTRAFRKISEENHSFYFPEYTLE